MLKLFILVCFAVNGLVDSIPIDEPVIEAHIVGGNDTDISQVPYQVAVYEQDEFLCGGFIVSPSHIVTAGQCVMGLKDTYFSVRAGSSSNEDGGVLVNAKKVYRNPKYDDETADYDVAVIELQTPLKLNNKTMKAIKLGSVEPSSGSNVVVSGWGFTSERLGMPETLQSVTIPVVDRTKCTALYKEQDVDITPRMMCAGAVGKTAYYGDGGGPLVYKGVVVGIASFGVECPRNGIPGVYTNIANPEITKFIKDIAKL